MAVSVELTDQSDLGATFSGWTVGCRRGVREPAWDRVQDVPRFLGNSYAGEKGIRHGGYAHTVGHGFA